MDDQIWAMNFASFQRWHFYRGLIHGICPIAALSYSSIIIYIIVLSTSYLDLVVVLYVMWEHLSSLSLLWLAPLSLSCQLSAVEKRSKNKRKINKFCNSCINCIEGFRSNRIYLQIAFWVWGVHWKVCVFKTWSLSVLIAQEPWAPVGLWPNFSKMLLQLPTLKKTSSQCRRLLRPS